VFILEHHFTSKLFAAVREAFRNVYPEKKGKSNAVPLHAMEALGMRGGMVPTHS
jgi:hypothetical protein